MANWVKIKNEYINGNISYRKLAEKHKVSSTTLTERAVKEKWFQKRKEQRVKIEAKTEQKTAEILAQREADRLLRISNAADKLLEKIELATEQLDMYLAKDKRKYPRTIMDKETGEEVKVWFEEEVPKSVKLAQIDRAGLKQIASTLKDLRDIQFSSKEETPPENPVINITVSAATPDDMEVDED